MTGLTRTLTLLAVLAAASPALAQKNAAPEVTVAHKGAAKALTDLETLLKLTTPQQQKQWGVIDKNMQVFLIGIDEKRPLKIDLRFEDNGKVTMRPAFPVKDIRQFRFQNLKPFGITTIRIARTLYKCKGQVFQGYMRYRDGYAIFSENKSDLPIPTPKLPSPAATVAGLLSKYDAAFEGINDKTDAASIAARKNWIDKHRKELLALVKKMADESEADFELRKLLVTHQTNELERFYSQAAKLTTGWKMNLATMTGRLDIHLTPIPRTALAKSVESIGTKPSYFASVPRVDGAILSARVNWPLDEMRQKHTLELVKAIKKSELSKIEADSNITAEQKKAHQEIGKLVEKLLAKNANAGIFDMFAEVHPNKAGSNTAIGAFRTVDGTAGIEILKLLPKTGKGRTVKLDIAKVGDVRIHKAEVKLTKTSLLKMFLGGGEIYVGTSKDAIWFASGNTALEELRNAIEKRAVPPVAKASDVFIDVFVKVAPWLELRDKGRGPKGNPELRALAKTAFSGGKDGVSLQFRRNGMKVLGNVDLQTDVLRFAGAMISKFSKETLDENNGKKPKIKLKR